MTGAIEEPGRSRIARRTAGAVTLAIAAGYLGMFWNAYLSPTTGGELFFLAEKAAGNLPYRDSHYSSQPLPFLLPFALESIFGRHLIVLWATGAVLRLVATACVYLWLSRLTRPWAACLATVTAFVVSSGDISDFPAFYNHVSVSLAAAGAYVGWLSTVRRRAPLAVTSGALFALAFLTKQTTGVLIPAAVVPVLLLSTWILQGKRQTLGLGAALASGASLPLVFVYGWLWQNDLLGPYVEQVFLRAASSKGGFLSTLIRPLVDPFALEMFGSAPYLGMAGAFVLCILGLGRPAGTGNTRFRVSAELGVALPLLGAIVLGRAWRAGAWLSSRDPLLAASYMAMAGCLVLGVAAAVQVIRARGAIDRGLSVLALSTLGFSSAYALSISWAVFELMAFPGLAILMALALGAVEGSRARKAAGVLVVVTCIGLVAVGAWRKHFLPYSWVWAEPPLSQSRVASALPELSGFLLSESTARTLDGVTSLIRRHSEPSEKIWVYPAMAIFYGLSDRRPSTFAAHHWMDTCPDDVAEKDALRLLADPPRVIVAQRWPIEAIAANERYFRSGNRSGQRRLFEALEHLLPMYALVGTFPTQAMVRRPPIQVFALVRRSHQGREADEPERLAPGRGREAVAGPGFALR